MAIGEPMWQTYQSLTTNLAPEAYRQWMEMGPSRQLGTQTYGGQPLPLVPTMECSAACISVWPGDSRLPKLFNLDELGMAFAFFHALLIEKGLVK